MQETFAPIDAWYLTGPTASGKTAVGLALARALDAEIVSLDSMALYRGMDIGTAKPSAEERRAVPHHLIDVLEPHEETSIARYFELAQAACAQIRGRGREPLFVGGTPLYLKALVRGLFVGPPADWDFRRRMEQEADQRGDDWLRQRVAEIDAETARRVRDRRRLIRALEVYEKTGRPISELQRQSERVRPPEECRAFRLDWPRRILHQRINRRVEEMFAAGLVEEVRRLLSAERPPGRTAMQAVGYRQVAEHLAGKRDLEETIEKVKARTRQFAKRQMTWFRKLTECRVVPMQRGFDAEEVARRMIQMAEEGTC